MVLAIGGRVNWNLFHRLGRRVFRQIISQITEKLFLADKLSLSSRTASSGLREKVISCIFYIKIILYNIILYGTDVM